MINTLMHNTPNVGEPPTKCPHCKRETCGGTHNGCVECGKVKHTSNGRKKPYGE